MYHHPLSAFAVSHTRRTRKALQPVPPAFPSLRPASPAPAPTLTTDAPNGHLLPILVVVAILTILAVVVWFFGLSANSVLTAGVVLTHPACAQSFKEDRAVGLIYGPYVIQRTDLPRVRCNICKGKGTYGNYTNDPLNGDKAGTPAPCEFCHGVGTRVQLQPVTMEEWVKRTGLCVYCGTPQRGARSTTEAHANV